MDPFDSSTTFTVLHDKPYVVEINQTDSGDARRARRLSIPLHSLPRRRLDQQRPIQEGDVLKFVPDFDGTNQSCDRAC